MNVLEHTSNRLVLRYNPLHIWLTAGAMVVAVFLPPEDNTPPAAHTGFTIVALVFAIGFLLWKGDRVTCYFDKHRGHFVRKSSGLRGTRSLQVPMKDIAIINVVERRRYRRRFRQAYVYWVYVDVRTSDRICLTSDSFFRKGKALNIAWQISDFLDLPPYSFQNAPPRSFFSLW
jgi:hypothetical protein